MNTDSQESSKRRQTNHELSPFMRIIEEEANTDHEVSTIAGRLSVGKYPSQLSHGDYSTISAVQGRQTKLQINTSNTGNSGLGHALKAPRNFHSQEHTLKKDKLPYLPRAIVDEEARYQSVDQAREHLRELIRQNRSMLQHARDREFQIIQEEIGQREKVSSTLKGGICSYKMPRIRVEARDATQRHLKVLLEGLQGKIKLPLTSKSSLDGAYGRNEKGSLPNINFRDKKQDRLDQEQREVMKSLKQFKTLKELNDTLLKVPHIAGSETPAHQKLQSNRISDSRVDLLTIRRGGVPSSGLSKDTSLSTLHESIKPRSVTRLDRQIEAYHVNAKYKVDYDQENFQKFCRMKDDAFNLNREFYVNARTNESHKLILHMGEGPSLVKVSAQRALYIGGLAVLPNRHVLLFDQSPREERTQPTQTHWCEYFPREDLKYSGREQEELFEELERQGHFSFYHNDKIYIFGGGKGKSTGKFQRTLTNDIVIYDYHTHDLIKHHYDKAILAARMYHCAFVMDNYLYSIGGQTTGSRIIDSDLLEINLGNYSFRHLEVKNRQLMPDLANMRCCMVFFPSRYEQAPHEGDPSGLTFKRLKSAINWSEAEHNIKQEGVYFFGGRDAMSMSQNVLVVMTVTINANSVVHREFSRPATIGEAPGPRYMHSMDYYKEGNVVIIAGGRNDQLHPEKILNDVWVLKLSNLEWQRVILGGYQYLKPRFNFASVILGSKLIVAGGIGNDYKLLKDFQELELDQRRVKKQFVHKSKILFLRNQGQLLSGGPSQLKLPDSP